MFDYLFSAQGRIGRAKFWLAVLITLLLSFAGEFIGALMDDASLESWLDSTYQPGIGAVIALLLTGVPATWISVVTGIKRCHDRGQSGWYILIALIPIAGWIWYIVNLGILKGDPGANKYGPSPHAIEDAVEVFS